MSEKTVNEQETVGGSVTDGLPRGFTYFVRDGDMIKIGSSMRPLDRIGNLQTGSSRPLEVLAIVSQEVAPEFETHQLFTHLRVRGEWFRAKPELLDFISDLKAGIAPPEIVEAPVAPVKPQNDIKTMKKRLTQLRIAYGPETPMGHICSNLLEQLPLIASYVRPTWATHDFQTLAGQVRWQMNRMAELKAATH